VNKRKPRSTSAADTCCAPMASALADKSHADKVDKRLARIEGQIGGLRRMVGEGRYCIDVLAQIQAVQESLRSTSALLLEAHVRSCVDDAFASRNPARKETVLKELASLLSKK